MSPGIGGDGKERGINHFAHKGLMKRFLCSNLSLANKIYPLVMDNAFPCFMIPQGVLSHMMRAIASGKPGVFTHVGMKTFVDPRVDGGRINDAAKSCDDIPRPPHYAQRRKTVSSIRLSTSMWL